MSALFALALLYSLYFARAILLPVVMALLLALVLAPAVRALARIRIAPALGAGIVVAAIVAGLGTAAYNLFDPANQWVDDLPRNARKIELKLRGVKESVQQVNQAAQRVQEMAGVKGDSKARGNEIAKPHPSLASRLFAGAGRFVVYAFATLVLLYFFLASGDRLLKKILPLLRRREHKRAAIGIARAMSTDMSRYLFTITCINAGLGVATATAMHWLGMPNPGLWGVLAAVLNYVPYLGAAANMSILTFVAFVTFDDPEQALWVPAVQFSLHLIEGQFLTPILTARSVLLDPLVTFLGMLFWEWLWGIPGALMAVPLLMACKIVCAHIPRLARLAVLLGDRIDVHRLSGARTSGRMRAAFE